VTDEKRIAVCLLGRSGSFPDPDSVYKRIGADNGEEDAGRVRGAKEGRFAARRMWMALGNRLLFWQSRRHF